MKKLMYEAWQWGEDALRALAASPANPYNYEEWNILVYGLVFPLLIALFTVVMSVLLFRIARRENLPSAARCARWNLAMLIACGLSAVALALVCVI